MEKLLALVSFIILLQIPLVVADLAFTFSFNITACSNNNRTIYIAPIKIFTKGYSMIPPCFTQTLNVQNCSNSSSCLFLSSKCINQQSQNAIVKHTGCTINTLVENEYKEILLLYKNDIHSSIANSHPFIFLKSHRLINGSFSNLSEKVNITPGETLQISIEANHGCSQNYCGQNCNEEMNNGCLCQANRTTICPSTSSMVLKTTLFTPTTNISTTTSKIMPTKSSVLSTIMQTAWVTQTMSKANVINSTPTLIDPTRNSTKSNLTQSNLNTVVSDSKNLVVGLSVTLAIAIIAIIATLVVFLCKQYGHSVTNSCRPIEDKRTDEESLNSNSQISSNRNFFNRCKRTPSSDDRSEHFDEESTSSNATVEPISSNGSIKEIITTKTSYAGPPVSTTNTKTDNTHNNSTSNSTTNQNSDKTSKNKVKYRENETQENPIPSTSKHQQSPDQQNLDDEKDTELNTSLHNVIGNKEPSHSKRSDQSPRIDQDEDIVNATSSQALLFEQTTTHCGLSDSGISTPSDSRCSYIKAEEAINSRNDHVVCRKSRSLIPEELRNKKVMLNNFIQVNDHGTVQPSVGISRPNREEWSTSPQICTDNQIHNSPIIFLNVYADRNEKQNNADTKSDHVQAKNHYVKISYRGQPPYSEPKVTVQRPPSESKNHSASFDRKIIADSGADSGHTRECISNETLVEHLAVEKTQSDEVGLSYDSEDNHDTISKKQKKEKLNSDNMIFIGCQKSTPTDKLEHQAEEKSKSSEIHSSHDQKEFKAENSNHRKSESVDGKTKTPKKKKRKSSDKNPKLQDGEGSDTSPPAPLKRKIKDKESDINHQQRDGFGLSEAQMRKKWTEEAPKMVTLSPRRLKNKYNN